MAWGISGSLGTEIRKQQSDDLKDQLLQQQMAQRIKEFDEDLKLRREQAIAQAEDRKSLAADRASEQAYRTGELERRNRIEAAAEEREAGKGRAISNIQGLIPLLQPGTPEFRAEAAGQALRISPDRTIDELLRTGEAADTLSGDDARTRRQTSLSSAD